MNTPATNFNVSIIGLRREDQTLVAAIDPLLDDADGAGLLQYQWQRSDGSGGWSDIAGATTTFYTLGDPDVGHEVRLKVYFVDGGGTTEAAYSAPTATIENVNDTPSGSPSITGVLREDETVTADVSALGDDDGLPSDPADYAYQWQRSEDGGQTWSDITAANDASYTLGDEDAAQTVRVKVVYTDDQGTTETVYSAAEAVEFLNHAPVNFTVTIAGDAIEETTLTATASVTSDDDGLPEPLAFTYQWQSSSDGVEWANINGATSAEFTPDDAEVGLQLRAVASYKDLKGTVENISSGPTATVQTVNDAAEGLVGLASSVEVAYDEFRVNTYTDHSQSSPSVTSLNDGGFVVTWMSYGQDGSAGGIYGQRYDVNGLPAGDEFRVNTYTHLDQSGPSVTSLNDGGFVVTWQSDFQDGSSTGIYGQRYDAYGTPEGDEFQVNTYTEGSQRWVSVTSLSNGGFVVTWQSDFQDGSAGGIYGQRYDVNGLPAGDEFRVNTYTSGSQTSPSVTSLSDGGFVVTWAKVGNYGIYGQRYDENGTPVEDQFQVSTFTGWDQTNPSVSSLNDGGFVVTWINSWYGVFGRQYDENGTPVEYQTNQLKISNSTNDTSVASLTDGGFVVTWSLSNPSGSNPSDIYGQRYDANGTPEGDEFQVHTYTDKSQYLASVTSLNDGGFVVTWASYQQDGSRYGIYGQRFSATGEKIDYIFDANADYVEGVAVTADTSLVSDPDGLGTFSYQWQRSEDGGGTWSDIAGAKNDQYVLTNDDALNQVRVAISYVDGQGFDNVVYSDASPTVQNVNEAPVGFEVTITGDATENVTLLADATVVSDGDGLPDPLEFAFQWQSSSDDGVNWAVIDGATASTLELDDAQVDQQVRVVTSYTDAKGTVESVASAATAAVENVNDAPVDFTVAISGAKAEDQTLTAVVGAVTDEDGVGDLTYQWQRTNASAAFEDIAGATSSTYTLGDADVGTQIRVTVSYLDGHGSTETKSSGATFPIANVDDEADVTFTATGTAREGETLSISYSATDVDGVIVAQSHVWQTSADGGATWIDVSAIDAETFIVGEDDPLIGQHLRVLVSTTDEKAGQSETAFDWGEIKPSTIAVTGRVSDASDQAIDGVQVTLSSVVQADQTITYDVLAGEFIFSTEAREDAIVTADKAIDDLSQDALGAFDALQALRLAVGLTKSDGTAEWHDYIAADINKDGRVGADDALNILKYAVGLTDGPSIDWVFVDSDADWSNIDRGNTSYDEGISLGNIITDTGLSMTAILVGDVDGSYLG